MKINEVTNNLSTICEVLDYHIEKSLYTNIIVGDDDTTVDSRYTKAYMSSDRYKGKREQLVWINHHRDFHKIFKPTMKKVDDGRFEIYQDGKLYCNIIFIK